MGNRETTLEREPDHSSPAVDVSVDSGGRTTGDADESDSRGAGLRARAGSLFSIRQFLLAGVGSLAGLVLVGGALPLGPLGSLFGVVLGSFLHGAVTSERRYTEAAAAGGAVGGGAALLDHLVLTLAGVGVPIVAVGALAGLVAAVVGHYFGRDLRDGLTREL